MADQDTDAAETKTAEKSETITVPAKKKNNKTLWIVLGIVVVFLFVIPGILLAVGGSILKDKLDDPTTGEKLAEGLLEKATGSDVDVDAKDGSYTVKGEDGSSVSVGGENQRVPEDFPKDVAKFLDEKKVVFVLKTNNESKRTWSVTTTVDMSYDAAVKHFQESIQSPEYTDVSSYGFGETQTFSGKKDGKSVMATVNKSSDDGSTSVSYIVTEE